MGYHVVLELDSLGKGQTWKTHTSQCQSSLKISSNQSRVKCFSALERKDILMACSNMDVLSEISQTENKSSRPPCTCGPRAVKFIVRE